MFIYKQQNFQNKIVKIGSVIVSKTCSAINLTKEVQYLYSKHYKILLKEIEDRNKWEGMLMDWKSQCC